MAYKEYQRGAVFRSPIGGVVVLGGPNRLCHDDYYTVKLLADMVGYDHLGNPKVMHVAGKTFLTTLYDGFAGYNPKLAGASLSRNVIYGYCPECDEDEMIFYEGDYICAWCREHLEEEIY
jgi:hypothetical protein